jgi:hypothetical protein
LWTGWPWLFLSDFEAGFDFFGGKGFGFEKILTVGKNLIDCRRRNWRMWVGILFNLQGGDAKRRKGFLVLVNVGLVGWF